MPQTELKQAIAKILDEVTALRHELHRYPELRFEEHWTSDRIVYELAQSSITATQGFGGGTGILADIPGKSNRIIALRADMDGLEIEEETGLSYASEIPGHAHTCGHDGHIAMLCGAAKILAQQADLACTVRLIFQPGEELGMGGQRMAEEGVMEGVEAVFGMHGWPSIPLGKVGIKSGIAMAGGDWFHITIEGQGCHGADPASGVDPIRVAAHIVIALLNIVERLELEESAVVSVGTIHGGTANNIIPKIVEISGSCRTLSAETRDKVLAAIEQIAVETGEAFQAGITVEFDDNVYIPLYNDPAICDFVQQAIDEELGAGTTLLMEAPSLASEDFAYYLQQVPGAFLWLGTQSNSGNTPTLHSPHFDFNDDALATGIEVWFEPGIAFFKKRDILMGTMGGMGIMG